MKLLLLGVPTTTGTIQQSTTEEVSSPPSLSTDQPTPSPGVLSSSSATLEGTVYTTLEGTVLTTLKETQPVSTTAPLLTTDHNGTGSPNLSENLKRFGQSIQELAKISHVRIESLIILDC